jgi:hypothetical protein
VGNLAKIQLNALPVNLHRKANELF